MRPVNEDYLQAYKVQTQEKTNRFNSLSPFPCNNKIPTQSSPFIYTL